MTNEEGFLPRPYALYKDMTSISGTRPYLPGDSLRMIHWKATAKTGELQTKTYEPSTGMTWTVALIFDTSINGIMTREQMEQLVSEAAYICHYAHQNQIQLEIFTNIKPPGREMIFHINLDQSTSHLAKVMELLAMIQGNQIKTRISDALNEMDHHITFPRQIFFIGRAHLDADDYFLQKWRRYGHQCYRVNEENNMAYLTPLNKGAVS